MGFKEIAKQDDLKNGEMKSYKIDDNNKVLLCRINNEFFAIGAACTHYGAPLEEGILKDDTIICPWHHACFNAKSGNLLEPPAMDALQKYEVKTEGDSVKINVPEEIQSSRKPAMVKKDNRSDSRTFVILGAGASAYFAAQSMRENGFKGNIIMVTEENRNPYDRPNLSKDYLAGSAEPEWMPLRPDEFFVEYGIEIKQEMTVTGLNLNEKLVSFMNGENLKYDKLLIATGETPRKLDVPGAELKNIFYLRSFGDADKIIETVKISKKAVIIGAGFIAMETAHSLTERNIKVTVFAPDEVPFERNFGKEIGKLFKKEHEKNGTSFKLKSKVKGFKGSDKIKSVLLESGEEIETDFVIIGIGVKPATKFISGIDLLEDGSIKTDSYLRIIEDVYASGDIASFPDSRTGKYLRIEHWRLAQQLGRIAGANMSGRSMKYEEIPFFWTAQAGMTLRYVGFTKIWDEIIIDGNIADKNFIAFYIKNNVILAAAAINRDKEMDAVHLLMKEQRLPEIETLRHNPAHILSLL
jgi:NADPH-dependent 2,4-dienoyl-CoA reductase/sulfur reductase-like enzyme/nitrite reductase/ring-hydroxylating ferredoxin subunit